ncbi:MAG TPA: dethiobiotin synthase [Solirubrobacteraceae bacterium]|nr:dethiobiotin synthase [Solirubrobacteraceae bacterium]
MRGLFVTATDTGVGKTVLSASLLAAMSAAGEAPGAYKPVVTGLEDPHEIAARGGWPADHELLARLAGMRPEQVSPLRFGPAVSPHLAAALAGKPVDPHALLASARRLARGANARAALVVEGVGGLLAPLADEYSVCDLAVDLALPVLVAARPGLGTINHTLLTLEAARSAGLRVAAVVLTPWPARPSRLQSSNRETIARLGAIEVATLARVARPAPGELADAGAALPWRRWLDDA